MNQHNVLRKASSLCYRFGIIGGILWIVSAIYFFVQYFSNGIRVLNVRDVIQGYGGALIASIIPILLLYAAGGVVNLLLDIEANTRNQS